MSAVARYIFIMHKTSFLSEAMIWVNYNNYYALQHELFSTDYKHGIIIATTLK